MLRPSLIAIAAALALGAGAAHAQEAPTSPQPTAPPPSVATSSPPAATAAEPKPGATAAAPPAAPATFWSTFKVSGHVEAGMTLQPDEPNDNLNFGHLFTDRANEPVLNQALLTIERPADPKAPGYDFGFRFQAMYGGDARYTRFTHQFDGSGTGHTAFDVVEANLQAHLPLLFKGGIDVKAGEYATPIGLEVIDASANPFYSHSYIFNFGIPLKHTGILTTTHVSPLLDIYASVDTGVNTSVGDSDNNSALAALFGFGLNFDKVTVLALSHIGAENPRGTFGVRPNKDLRYLNDVLVTWKISDKLTSTTEFNYIKDDGFDAQGGGVAQYLQYALNDHLTLGGRAEIWRDDQGFFVAAFPGPNDLLRAEEGRSFTAVSVGPATYAALTLGLSWKPPLTPKIFDGLVLRPEIRYDYSLDGRAFHEGARKDQLTIAGDVIIPFSYTR